jgi:hypothetical protein
MVYNTQDYWALGLFPSSSTLEKRKHDVSETYLVSEISCFLFYRVLYDGKFQKPSNPMDSSGLGEKPVAGSCEHGNKPSGPM